jgi:hypothetical protein
MLTATKAAIIQNSGPRKIFRAAAGEDLFGFLVFFIPLNFGNLKLFFFDTSYITFLRLF